MKIQRARAHWRETRPHMKKLLRGGRALGSAAKARAKAKKGYQQDFLSTEDIDIMGPHVIRAILDPFAETMGENSAKGQDRTLKGRGATGDVALLKANSMADVQKIR